MTNPDEARISSQTRCLPLLAIRLRHPTGSSNPCLVLDRSAGEWLAPASLHTGTGLGNLSAHESKRLSARLQHPVPPQVMTHDVDGERLRGRHQVSEGCRWGDIPWFLAPGVGSASFGSATPAEWRIWHITRSMSPAATTSRAINKSPLVDQGPAAESTAFRSRSIWWFQRH
jgi:hypothetical protein